MNKNTLFTNFQKNDNEKNHEMQCVEIELDPQESFGVGSRIEEGSILGGLGNLFDGDGRQYYICIKIQENVRKQPSFNK